MLFSYNNYKAKILKKKTTKRHPTKLLDLGRREVVSRGTLICVHIHVPEFDRFVKILAAKCETLYRKVVRNGCFLMPNSLL